MYARAFMCMYSSFRTYLLFYIKRQLIGLVNPDSKQIYKKRCSKNCYVKYESSARVLD